jgi:hypothetical protein
VEEAVAESNTGIIITNVKVIPGTNQAEISFTTNVATQSKLEWGFSDDFEIGALQNLFYGYEHTRVITGLSEGLTYQLRITANSSSGAIAYKDISFATLLPTVEIGPFPNPQDFLATARENDIELRWTNPRDPRFNDVRIVRTEGFYPIDQFDGTPIYEGDGESFIDTSAKPGVTYYYAIFARSLLGEYSSGALAQARIAIPGEEPVSSVIDPFADIPQAKDVHPMIKALTLADFDFIQDGKNLVTVGKTIAIRGDKNLTIRLKYDKVPEILKTVAFTLQDPTDPTKVFPFLLRVNSDKTYYESTIGSLGRSGRYGMSVVILDYENNGLLRLDGTLAALAFSAPLFDFAKSFDFLGLLILLLFIILVILAITLLRKWVYYSPEYSAKAKSDYVGNDAPTNARNIIVGFFAIIIMNLLVLTFVTEESQVFAAFNPEINYQGKLVTATNSIVPDGTFNIRFKLYTTLSGGSPIWTETWCNTSDCAGTGTGSDNRIAITNGLFSTMLGSTTAFSDVDFNQPLYLGVEIGGSGTTASWDGEMSPRKILGAVPASFYSGTSTVAISANKLSGLNAEQFLRSDEQNATSSATTFLNVIQTGAGKIAEFFGSASQSVLALLSNGNVGIGTTSPFAKLSVEGDTYIGGNLTATGTLSAQNISASGFTLNGFTENSLLFVGANGAVTEDADVLSWNPTTNRLGVGRKDPVGVIHAPVGSTALFGYLDTPFVSFGEYQNYLLQTETFETANWVKTDISGSVTANSATDPRGTVTAENIPAGNNGDANINQVVTNATLGDWTYSIYLKSQAGQGTVRLRIDSNTQIGEEVTLSIGPEWRRYAVTQNFTSAHTNKTVRVISGSLAIATWGAQLEPTSFARPYSGIRTTTNLTALTRTSLISTPLTIVGALSGVTSLTMNGAFAGATTGSFTSNVTIGGNLDVGGLLTAGKLGMSSISIGVDPSIDQNANLYVAGGASAFVSPVGTTIFNDSFEGAALTLASHSPNTPDSSWAILIQNGGVTLRTQATGRADVTSSLDSAGVLYIANTVSPYPTADYEVKVNTMVVDTADDVVVLAARIQENGDMYAFKYSGTAANSGLYKRVGGTWTSLGIPILSAATTGGTIRLRVAGTTITAYRDNVLLISVSDASITQAGKAGLGAGNVITATDDATTDWDLDEFTVTAYESIMYSAIFAQGNVGIGTTSPYAKLSVAGQAVGEYFTATSTTATSTLPNLSLTNLLFGSDYLTDITGSGLSVSNGALTVSSFASTSFANMLAGFDASGNLTSTSSPQVAYINATSTTATSTFAGGLTAGGSTGLTVLQNGNVGVGITNPSYKLDVNGTLHAQSGITSHASISIVGGGSWFAHSQGAAIRMTQPGGSYLPEFHFVANTNELATILNSGNFGIGTTSPYAKLSVVGQVVGEYFIATSTTATSTFAGGLTAGGSTGLTVLQNGMWGLGRRHLLLN